jgi:hypothetical protein
VNGHVEFYCGHDCRRGGNTVTLVSDNSVLILDLNSREVDQDVTHIIFCLKCYESGEKCPVCKKLENFVYAATKTAVSLDW